VLSALWVITFARSHLRSESALRVWTENGTALPSRGLTCSRRQPDFRELRAGSPYTSPAGGRSLWVVPALSARFHWWAVLNLADGVAVSLLTGSACHKRCSVSAAGVPLLLNTDACQSSGCEVKSRRRGRALGWHLQRPAHQSAANHVKGPSRSGGPDSDFAARFKYGRFGGVNEPDPHPHCVLNSRWPIQAAEKR